MPTFTGQIGTANSRPLYLWPGVAPSSSLTFSGTATFSGAGTLAVTGTPKPAVTISLTGSGTATPTAAPAFPVSSSLSGSGTLSATGTPKPAVTLALTGLGNLTASGSGGAGAANLAGTGTLTATGTPKPGVTIALSGAGTLAATESAMAAKGTASLSGSGSIAPAGSVGTYLRINLCTQPNFNDGVITLWNGNSCTIVADSTYARSGAYSMKVTGLGSSGAPYMGYLPVQSNLSYALSAYLNLPVGLAQSIVPVALNWYDASLTVISTALSSVIPASTTTSGFQRYSLVATAPSTAAWVLIFTYPNLGLGISESYWVDDWLFEQSSILGSYFDGSSAPDATFIRSWAGTPNASTSTESKPTYKTVGGATFSRINGSQLLLPHRNGITQMAYAP